MYLFLIGYTQIIPTHYMMKWLGTGRQPFDKQPIVSGLVMHLNDNYLNGLGLDSHSEGNQPNMFCLGTYRSLADGRDHTKDIFDFI